MTAIKQEPLLKQFKIKKRIIVKFEDFHLLLKENRNFVETGTTATSGTIPTIIKTV